MKHLFYIILFTSLFFSCENKQPTLYLIGDSTMANKPNVEFPERGWGQQLPQFFDTIFVIDNHAKNGRSTRSFIYESRWDTVYSRLEKGDYIIIQFGHNDDVETKIGRHSTPDEYAYNLTKFVKESIDKGAKPILCTPIIRRNYINGELVETHGVYPDKVREIANQLQIPLIDLHKMSKELVLELGEEKSKELFLHLPANTYQECPEGRIDNTHFSEKGATKMANLFINELSAQKIKISKYLLDENK